MTQYDYLAHHGILGQKWGVRRYQNPDGSLTEAGKKRYAKDVDRVFLAKKGPAKQKANAALYERIKDASKTSEVLSGIIKEARKLNFEEEADWESWMGDESAVKETAKSYLESRNKKKLSACEEELRALQGIKRKTDDDQEMIEILSSEIVDRKKYRVTDDDVTKFLKNAGSDVYTYMWSHEQSKHPEMIARSDRLFALSQEYHKASEKYFKDLLGDYGEKRIKSLPVDSDMSYVYYLARLSGDSFDYFVWHGDSK